MALQNRNKIRMVSRLNWVTNENIHQDGEYLAGVRDVCKDMSLVWPFMFEVLKGDI